MLDNFSRLTEGYFLVIGRASECRMNSEFELILDPYTTHFKCRNDIIASAVHWLPGLGSLRGGISCSA